MWPSELGGSEGLYWLVRGTAAANAGVRGGGTPAAEDEMQGVCASERLAVLRGGQARLALKSAVRGWREWVLTLRQEWLVEQL